jgi:NitT/TauT family transport system permease protein
MRLSLSPRCGGYAFAAALIILWWAGTVSGVLAKGQIPSPGEVLLALADDPHLFINAILRTVRQTMIAFALGGAVGLTLGLCHGVFPAVRDTTGPFIEGLRPLPSIALIPIAIVFVGMGDTLNVTIAAFACVWPIFINTHDGVKGINPLLFDTAFTIGITRRRLLQSVILQAALPMALTGLRLGLGIAFAVEVSVEMVIPKTGIGALAATAALSGHNALLYAAIAAAALTGLMLNQAFRWTEFALLRTYGPQWSKRT